MPRIFALLILVAAVTGAAAGERFPILQPDQMNATRRSYSKRCSPAREAG